MPEIDLKHRRLRRRSRGPLPNESALVNGLLVGMTAVAAGSLVVGAFALLDQKSSVSYAYVAPAAPSALGGLMNRPVDSVVDERFFRETREPRDFSPVVFSVSPAVQDKAPDAAKGKSKDKDKGRSGPGTSGIDSPAPGPATSVPVVVPEVVPEEPSALPSTTHHVSEAAAPAQAAAVRVVKEVAPVLAPVAKQVVDRVNEVLDSVEDVLPPLGLLG